MGKVVQAIADNNGQTPGVTVFESFAQNYGYQDATEVNAKFKLHSPGTFSNLYTRFSQNNLSTAATTIRFRKNAANGNQVISIPASTTGEFTDASNTDALVDNDFFNLSFAIAAGGIGASTPVGHTMTFQATTNHVSFIAATNLTGITTASTTFFFYPSGFLSAQTTESLTQFKTNCVSVLKKAQVHVSTNSRTVTTLNSRKNTANGSISISIPASTTGLFEDTTNTDTWAIGDLFNFALVTDTGTNTLNIDWIGAAVENTTDSVNNVWSSSPSQTRTASATSTFYSFVGSTLVPSTTESLVQLDQNFNGTFSHLKYNVSASTYSVAGTGTFRVNAADATQTVSFTALTTGVFEDTTHTDNTTSGDNLATKIVGGTTGSIQFEYIALQSGTISPLVITKKKIPTLLTLGVG